jgi:hypothetical protein
VEVVTMVAVVVVVVLVVPLNQISIPISLFLWDKVIIMKEN